MSSSSTSLNATTRGADPGVFDHSTGAGGTDLVDVLQETSLEGGLPGAATLPDCSELGLATGPIGPPAQLHRCRRD